MTKFIKKINDKVVSFYALVVSMIVMKTNLVFATDLMKNPITQGAKQMLQDASKVVMLLATVATPFFIALYQFKKKASDDEMEGKQYDKKTKAVILCYILIMSAGVIVNVVTHYFKIGGTAV